MSTTTNKDSVVIPTGFDPEDDLDKQCFKDGTYRIHAWTFQVRELKDNPRTWMDPEKLEDLGTSLVSETGQLSDLSAREVSCPDNPHIRWEAVGGNRRLRSSKENGIERIWLLVKQIPDNPTAIFKSALLDNGARDKPPLYDEVNALHRLLSDPDYPEDPNELSKQYGMAASSIISLAKIGEKLHEDLKPKLDAPYPKNKRIGLGEAKELIRIPLSEQVEVFEAAIAVCPTSGARKEMINGALATIAKQKKRFREGGKILAGRVPTVLQLIETSSPESISNAALAIRNERDVGGKAGVILSIDAWSVKSHQILDMENIYFSTACMELTPAELLTFYAKVRKVKWAAAKIVQEVEAYANKHDIRLD